MITFYLTLVRSPLEFFSVMWSPYQAINIKKPERMNQVHQFVMGRTGHRDVRSSHIFLLYPPCIFVSILLY